MNPIKTFLKGGVHPEENKLSADLPIQDFPMPKQLIVPLGQCLGAPADCIVNKGDHVLTGLLKGNMFLEILAAASGLIQRMRLIMAVLVVRGILPQKHISKVFLTSNQQLMELECWHSSF